MPFNYTPQTLAFEAGQCIRTLNQRVAIASRACTACTVVTHCRRRRHRRRHRRSAVRAEQRLFERHVRFERRPDRAHRPYALITDLI